MKRSRCALPLLMAVLAVLFQGLSSAWAVDTLIVTAEGLVDPHADTYKRDKGLMLDDLRQDARRQAVEKAVGTLVSGSSLVKNYTLIEDRVLTQSKGLIKQVIKESPPWQGEDGFMHMLIKAEVYLIGVEEALRKMSKAERVSLLKSHGNPTISVAVMIRDAKRSSDIEPERSPIAENILKEHFSKFGYRVWSEDTTTVLRREMLERSVLDNNTETTVSISQMKAADFTVLGEAKFKSISHKLAASGIELTKHVLTSWTVKCVDNNTGQEIYFNNQVPRKQSWADEDQALEDIGRLIGTEFSKDFFEEHLSKPTRIFQLYALGLPNYDIGVLLKKEFIGLRPIIDVNFRGFDAGGLSRYEVEFAGERGNFLQLLNNTIIKPLNSKCGDECFKLLSAHGEVVKLQFQTVQETQVVMERFQGMPPASLATATPQRLRSLIKDKATMEKVAAINPDAVAQLAQAGDVNAKSVLGVVENF